MRDIGDRKFWSFASEGRAAQPFKNATPIRRGAPCQVASFLDLAKKVAELQFLNPDLVLMFRGQDKDHKNRLKNTTLKPKMFRPERGLTDLPTAWQLADRYETLKRAESVLVDRYRAARMPEVGRLERHRILRWAILQHYEVCETPLLDVTQSLRIAASFGYSGRGRECYLFVIGVPQVGGAVTASVDAGIQILRLASICPPAAVRPHVQEGYLLGEYPELVDYPQKALYEPYEVDFGRRLVAKFSFNPDTFWRDKEFPRVEKAALYPAEDRDPVHRLASQVHDEIRRQ